MKHLIILLHFFIALTLADLHQDGILYPRPTETRDLISLDGIWNFVLAKPANPFEGFSDQWFTADLSELDLEEEILRMPVPSSYNDITTDAKVRDHVGIVWYSRRFYVPKHWYDSGRIWLRFGSVSYATQVWINGKLVLAHEIGHLPILAEITSYLNEGTENLITVACDNTLLAETIPQGVLSTIKSGRLVQTYSFDFFNYAGIDRSVLLYTTPESYIDDITIITDVQGTTGYIDYNITTIIAENITLAITIKDKSGETVATSDNCTGTILIPNAFLWWPYLMHPKPGYLYTFVVDLYNDQKELVDRYNQKFGIRSLVWTNTSFLINDKPIYMHGFGRHEDSDIRGKGFDLPLVTRDYNLIKWIGANAFRTSHYPYAEEIMDFADELGIMIIDECPSVNTEFFTDGLLVKHKKSLSELIRRDKNRPSVVLWSAANEPRTQFTAAKNYFKTVIEHIRSLDGTRPVTIVEAQPVTKVQTSQFVDIVSFNRYNAWYSQGGDLDIIKSSVIAEANEWHKKFNKPVIMQEYGADTLEGLHFTPDFIWSEEYQVHLMSRHFEAFDELRKQGFFIGEFIWNFADFKTAQTYTRVGGNKKGIFTRNRQPKSSAHHLRKRYWALAKELHNATQPKNLYDYVASSVIVKDEL